MPKIGEGVIASCDPAPWISYLEENEKVFNCTYDSDKHKQINKVKQPTLGHSKEFQANLSLGEGE